MNAFGFPFRDIQGLQLHQPVFDGIHHQLGGVFAFTFFKNVGAVFIDRTFADEEFIADFLIG